MAVFTNTPSVALNLFPENLCLKYNQNYDKIISWRKRFVYVRIIFEMYQTVNTHPKA